MKVCILAAGAGSRSFSQDLHKALLPLQNHAVLSHIIAQFPPDSEFVLALGHKQHQIRDFLKLAHPTLKVEFVDVDPYEGPGSGPGTSLFACREFLREPFWFTACDSLIDAELVSSEGNWVGVSEVDDIESWCSVNVEGVRVTGFKYKEANPSTRFAFIGVAFVKNHEDFWRGFAQSSLKSGERQVNDGLDALVANNLNFRKFRWRDTGSRDGYLALAREMKGFSFVGKMTELTYKYGDKIIKFYGDPKMAALRFKKATQASEVFPEAGKLAGNFMSYAFTEGVTLTDRIDTITCSLFLNWIEQKFWRPMVACPGVWPKQIEEFYVQKTLGRLAQLKSNSRYLETYEAGPVWINGTECEPVAQILEREQNFLIATALPSTFHGDLHNDNVIVTPAGDFRLIDWRDSFAGDPEVGDRYYDLAKFLHTLDFSVPAMTARNFKMTFEGEKIGITNAVSEPEHRARAAFWDFVKTRNYNCRMVDIVNGLVFINMAPLYDDELGLYLYLLGKHTLQQGINGEKT